MATFLVDVDGVLADLCTAWLNAYNQDYDDNLVPENLTRWATHEFVKPECGRKIYDYLWDENLYADVYPIDGASAGVRWLRDKGHTVVYVTSGIQPAKIRWLRDWNFLTDFDNWQFSDDVVITHNKRLIKGDYMIDDYPVNLDNFSGQPILFAQPWNQDSSYFPFPSWAHIIEHLSMR